MESQKICSFLGLVLLGFIGSSQAHKFYVGGKDGWVLNPSEDYNHWAGRNRFQVNDTLIFKYKNGSDSVLLVNKDHYDKCNKRNPTRILTTQIEQGGSKLKFHRSGPFFFISGHGDNCKKGQKLIVLVLAVRHRSPKSPPPVDAPAPDPRVEVNSTAPVPAPSAASEVGLGRLVGVVMGLGVVLGCLVGLF